MRALVVEQGYSRGALAAVRALPQAGWRVGVGTRTAAAWRRRPSPCRWPRGSGRRCRGQLPGGQRAGAAGACRRAAALLGALGWFGLAELQFLVPDDGIARLIDLNGRFYGSLALAVAAGANLPAVWAALATGRHVTPATAAGVRYSWWEGDLRRAVRERRGGLARDLAGALYAGAGAVHGIGRWRDPAPAVALLRRLAADRRTAR